MIAATAAQLDALRRVRRRRRIVTLVGLGCVLALVAAWNALLLTRPRGRLSEGEVAGLAFGVSAAILTIVLPLWYWAAWRYVHLLGAEIADGRLIAAHGPVRRVMFRGGWRGYFLLWVGRHRLIRGVFDDMRGELMRMRRAGERGRFLVTPTTRSLVALEPLPPDSAGWQDGGGEPLSPAQRERLAAIARRRARLATGFGVYLLAGGALGGALEIAARGVAAGLPGVLLTGAVGLYLLLGPAPRARRLGRAVARGAIAGRDGTVTRSSHRALVLDGESFPSVDPYLDDPLDDIEPGTRVHVDYLVDTRTPVAVRPA